MKKGLLLSIAMILVLGVGVSNAQLLTFGLKAGGAYTITALEDEFTDGFTQNNLFSGQGGAFARVNLPIIMGIKAELLYTQKGFDLENQGRTAKVRTGYVDFPILLSFGVLDILEIDFGPQFSFLTSSSIDAPGDPEFDDQFPDLGSTEIGFAVGADVNLPKNFGAYLRYSQMYNSYKSGNEDQKMNHGTVQFGIKYRIIGGS